jgi:hypothetical protein
MNIIKLAVHWFRRVKQVFSSRFHAFWAHFLIFILVLATILCTGITFILMFCHFNVKYWSRWVWKSLWRPNSALCTVYEKVKSMIKVLLQAVDWWLRSNNSCRQNTERMIALFIFCSYSHYHGQCIFIRFETRSEEITNYSAKQLTSIIDNTKNTKLSRQNEKRSRQQPFIAVLYVKIRLSN